MGISCNRLRFRRGLPAIQHGTARLPRAQSALAMTHQEVQWCASALLRLDGPVQAVRGVPGGASPSRTILHQRVVSTVISPETIFFDSSSTASVSYTHLTLPTNREV